MKERVQIIFDEIKTHEGKSISPLIIDFDISNLDPHQQNLIEKAAKHLFASLVYTSLYHIRGMDFKDLNAKTLLHTSEFSLIFRTYSGDLSSDLHDRTKTSNFKLKLDMYIKQFSDENYIH